MIQVDEESDVVGVSHGSFRRAPIQEGQRRVSTNSDAIGFVVPPRAVLVEGFASLDEFDLRTVFH